MDLLLVFLTMVKNFAETTECPPVAALDSNNYVCSLCSCNDFIINCQEKVIDNILPDYIWPNNETEYEVFMDNNVIRYVGEYPELPIVNLSLAHNLITEIVAGAFRNLTILKELNLSDNYLMSGSLAPQIFRGVYDPEYFEPIKTLRVLKLAHNRIEYVNLDLFEHLPFLEYLDLSYNPIRMIDDTTKMSLSAIPFLKVLDLSYTGLTELPENFLHSSAYLKLLNLEGNEFTEVPEKFIQDTKNFTFVKLDKNPVEAKIINLKM